MDEVAGPCRGIGLRLLHIQEDRQTFRQTSVMRVRHRYILSSFKDKQDNRDFQGFFCAQYFHILLSVVVRSVSAVSVASFYTCVTFPEEHFITQRLLFRSSGDVVMFHSSSFVSDAFAKNSLESQ